MKRIILFFTIIVALWSTSCKKYLAINSNPNQLTSASPDLVLPLAIVNTASLVSSLNDYGSQTVGYSANAGGYGGFGASWTYDYPNSTGDGYWSSAYTTLENFKVILNATKGSDADAYYNAAAKIMSAYIYQMMVDEFNNIPYTEALKGDTVLKPVYDDAATIYVTLASSLDSAIAEISNAQAPIGLDAGTDPLFAGNMTSWKQFANTLKLRLIIRATGTAQFANTSFSTDGFLASDAIVNPGYTEATATSGTQVNPSWGTWVATYAGSRVGQAWIPATYVFGYYDGTKLIDTFRGKIIFNGFNTSSSPTPYNQLGVTPPNNTLTSPANGGAWYAGGGSSGTSWGNASGVMKGPNMGEPLMLLAESDFLQAEADVRGILTQNAATDFNNGIVASFTYLYEGPDDATLLAGNPVADAATYEAQNSTSYLANFSLATTAAQQTEAIITQKYIAMNNISGIEAWSEYRRTGYPVNSPTVINNPYGSFTSTQSQATRPDGLPTRLPYPDTEVATNGVNVPQVSTYTSTIFWAH
jgi:hypothetical protein